MHNNFDNTARRLENIRTIKNVPREVLPAGKARNYLYKVTQRGYDVYAYQANHLYDEPARVSKEWAIWYYGKRYYLKEWVAMYYRTTDKTIHG